MLANGLRHLMTHYRILNGTQFESRLKTWSFLASFLHKTAPSCTRESDKTAKKHSTTMSPDTDLLGVNDLADLSERNEEKKGGRKKWNYPNQQFEKRLKFKRNLQDLQTSLEGEVLFGLHPILITLEQNRRSFHRLFLKDSIPRDEGVVRKIVQVAETKGIEVIPLPVKMLDILSKGAPHQGVCLDASQRKYETITDDKLDAALLGAQKQKLWVYLDKIQDPRNVGAIIRSSYYFGVEKIFVPKENSCRLSPVVHKASSGAVELLSLYALKDPEEFLQRVKDQSWNIVGTAGGDNQQADSPEKIDVNSYSNEHNTILLLGNEGKGLSPNLLTFCDSLVTVRPRGFMNPAVDSLNVSVATGILLHSLTRNFRTERG
ncbi:rRNA methyltransferase 1, mitochondrial-like [Lineus longissimus]|uniref:rRNA methyltransferase 1, mitochondrial-like n=1 Tax=Lineus longissimus TaxID=88925 RepID=UPI002B4D3B10